MADEPPNAAEALAELGQIRLDEQRLDERSRAVIEQAKGIIMGQRRCGPDEAFALLVKVSQDSNRKIRDVAAALVEQARRPPPPAASE